MSDLKSEILATRLETIAVAMDRFALLRGLVPADPQDYPTDCRMFLEEARMLCEDFLIPDDSPDELRIFVSKVERNLKSLKTDLELELGEVNDCPPELLKELTITNGRPQWTWQRTVDAWIRMHDELRDPLLAWVDKLRAGCISTTDTLKVFAYLNDAANLPAECELDAFLTMARVQPLAEAWRQILGFDLPRTRGDWFELIGQGKIPVDLFVNGEVRPAEILAYLRKKNPIAPVKAALPIEQFLEIAGKENTPENRKYYNRRVRTGALSLTIDDALRIKQQSKPIAVKPTIPTSQIWKCSCGWSGTLKADEYRCKKCNNEAELA